MARSSNCCFSSQAIMCVQLLSWCVAACLLLYRGVTTLRREPPVPVPRLSNDTLGNETASDAVDSALLNDTFPATGMRSTPAPVNRIPPPPDKTRSSEEEAAEKSEGVQVLYVYSHMNIPTQGIGSWQHQAEVARAGVDAEGSDERRTEHRERSSSSFGRIRYELRPASLILIVLGFSMLLVGPVVVVLRKCDSTLNHRRVVKLPTDEEDACDPPPSYDEATLGSGGAPRYSTLFEVRDSGELVCLNAPAPPAEAESAPEYAADKFEAAASAATATADRGTSSACRKS